jgi:serine/threonine-protein kinase RsbT
MVTVQKTETLPVQSNSDIVIVRQRVRAWAVELQFSLVDQTKLVTAASELARNTVEHGGGGQLEMSSVSNGVRKGLQLTFSDLGPGIPDVQMALKDGFSTGGGMGLGLSGSRRLVNDFDIRSELGKGTKVTVTRWK